MGDALSASSIVHSVAQEAARRVTRKVVADLQQMKDKLSGDDFELETTWDEICVQVQDEHSAHMETTGTSSKKCKALSKKNATSSNISVCDK